MTVSIEVQIPLDLAKAAPSRENAILTYAESYPGQGAGWVLYHLDATGRVAAHFVGGEWSELDRALEQGLEWLNGEAS